MLPLRPQILLLIVEYDTFVSETLLRVAEY